MKKHLGLLGVTLLSAAVFAHAKPVQAIAGPGLPEEPQKYPTLIISVDGILEGQDKEFYIKYLDYDLKSPRVEKKELLDLIKAHFASHPVTQNYEVVDFAPNARITNKDNDLYIAPEDGSVDFGNMSIQNYMLNGHVIIRPKVEAPIINPAKDVAFLYSLNFVDESGGSRKVFNAPIIEGTKPWEVGTQIDSKDLRQLAERVLNQYHGEYVLLDRESARVLHDNNRTATHLSWGAEYDYAIKERNIIKKVNSKTGIEEGASENNDILEEYYFVVKKDDLQNPKDNNHMVSIYYRDVATGEIVNKQTYNTPDNAENYGFNSIHFAYDNHKLFSNDVYNNNQHYVATGKFEENKESDHHYFNIDVVKYTENDDDTTKYEYKDGYNEERKLEYSYLHNDQSIPASNDKNQSTLLPLEK